MERGAWRRPPTVRTSNSQVAACSAVEMEMTALPA